MKFLVLVLAALCLSPVAMAAPEKPAPASAYHLPLTTSQFTNRAVNVACVADPGNDDTPDCASFEVKTIGYQKVCLLLRYVHSNASAVQLYKDASMDGAPPWGVLQLGDALSPPTVAMGDHKVEWLVSGNATWEVCFDVTAPWTRFRFTSTGGDAGDQITQAWVTLIGG